MDENSTTSNPEACAPRHPTVEDCNAGRTFCVIQLKADQYTLEARVSGRTMTILEDKGKNYRINPYGLIESIKLGEFQYTSTSAYSIQGVMIDYSENEAALIDAAQAKLQEFRKNFLERLQQHADAVRNLPAVVEGYLEPVPVAASKAEVPSVTSDAWKLRTALDNAYSLMDCKKELIICKGDLAAAAKSLTDGGWRSGKLVSWNHESLAKKASDLSMQTGRTESDCRIVLMNCSGSIELALRKIKGQPLLLEPVTG